MATSAPMTIALRFRAVAMAAVAGLFFACVPRGVVSPALANEAAFSFLQDIIDNVIKENIGSVNLYRESSALFRSMVDNNEIRNRMCSVLESSNEYISGISEGQFLPLYEYINEKVYISPSYVITDLRGMLNSGKPRFLRSEILENLAIIATICGYGEPVGNVYSSHNGYSSEILFSIDKIGYLNDCTPTATTSCFAAMTSYPYFKMYDLDNGQLVYSIEYDFNGNRKR